MFVQTMGDVEKVRKMVARGKEIQEMSYTSNGLRLLVEDPNSRHKPVPFQEFKAAFDRMDMLASRGGWVSFTALGKIPRRKAIAMVRAGLPLSRSELQGNPAKGVWSHVPFIRLSNSRTGKKIKTYPLDSLKWTARERSDIKTLMEVGGKAIQIGDFVYEKRNALARARSNAWPRNALGMTITPVNYSGLRGNPLSQSQKDMFRLKRASARGYRTFYRGPSKIAGSYKYTELDRIVDAIKNLKKKNHNDEMIESVVVKERPGHPRDFIIIVKHRYFVNGSRIYSAGVFTDKTIERFVPIIGTKTKRIGKSDYVFNIYGVRFPENLKSKPGKLFPNNMSYVGYKR